MSYITNAISTLTPWWTTISMLGYVLGITLAVASFFSALSRARERSSNNYIWLFIAAVLCLNFPALLDSISMSIFQQKSASSLLSYTSEAPNSAEYITFAIRAVMLIGVVAIIRGINFLRDTPQRAKDFPKAITHGVGGTLAVNIVQFLYAIGNTAGGDIKSYIEIIL